VGRLSGGITFIVVPISPENFFAGEKEVKNIPFSFSLEGLSEKISPGIYTTSVIYDVIEQ
jgi:hypothetical protein